MQYPGKPPETRPVNFNRMHGCAASRITTRRAKKNGSGLKSPPGLLSGDIKELIYAFGNGDTATALNVFMHSSGEDVALRFKDEAKSLYNLNRPV